MTTIKKENRIQVKKSPKTLSLFDDIRLNKALILKYKNENILLKKLCHFKGKIHEQANRRLKNNADSFFIELTAMQRNKARLVESYENDYQNTLNGLSSEALIEKNIAFKPTVLGDIIPKHKRLDTILNDALNNEIHLGEELFKAIKNELNH